MRQDEAYQYRIWKHGFRRTAHRHCQPESAPIKRIIQEGRDRGMLIDATYGRRTRAVIIMDSDHVILSAVQPETVANRLSDRDSGAEEDREE